MRIFAPSGYLSLCDARDVLMGQMHEGMPLSKEIEQRRRDGLQVADGARASAAAKALRQPILSGEIGLFALFSSRDTPMRLHNQALYEAALFPSNSTVLTFAYVDRDPRAPFGLSWSHLKELTRDPLCLEEKHFRTWLRKQERKKVWPCHEVGEVRVSPGRPSHLKDETIAVLEELNAQGKLKPSMLNKEVHALVQKARPSLRKVSSETVRRARKDADLLFGWQA
jgi:hypothetical protein